MGVVSIPSWSICVMVGSSGGGGGIFFQTRARRIQFLWAKSLCMSADERALGGTTCNELYLGSYLADDDESTCVGWILRHLSRVTCWGRSGRCVRGVSGGKKIRSAVSGGGEMESEDGIHPSY